MKLPRLTASRLELAEKCPGSFAHEHVATTNEAAEHGTAIHECIAALLEGEKYPLPPDEETTAFCRYLDARDLQDIARPNPGSSLYTEIALYLSPARGDAGVLEGNHHRDYSGAPSEAGSLVGTADVVAVENGRVRVTDWKTGRGEVPDPAENYQLRFLGLAAARAFSKDEAVVQLARIREDGSVDVRTATLDPEDLARTQRDLGRIMEGAARSREGSPVYRTGNHCRFCPALPHCPALSGAAQAILEGPPEELTPRRAAELWAHLQAVEAAAKRTREALTQYAYARPVPTAAGRALKVVETRRPYIDASKAFAVLRRYLPDDDLMAEAVSITKTSLSAALGKEAQKEVLAAFEEAGAVIESHSESLREVRN